MLLLFIKVKNQHTSSYAPLFPVDIERLLTRVYFSQLCRRGKVLLFLSHAKHSSEPRTLPYLNFSFIFRKKILLTPHYVYKVKGRKKPSFLYHVTSRVYILGVVVVVVVVVFVYIVINFINFYSIVRILPDEQRRWRAYL